MGLGAQFSASDLVSYSLAVFLGLEQFTMFLIIYSASRSPGFVPVQLLQGQSVYLWTSHLTSLYLLSLLAVMV